ncbi:MAG: DUF3179 domain-containing (seleno)protein [Bacteroidota bacterium]
MPSFRLIFILIIPLLCVTFAVAMAGWRVPAPAAPEPAPTLNLVCPVAPVDNRLPVSATDPRPAFDVRKCPDLSRIYDLYPAKDAIPALQAATFTPAADALWLDDRAPVLGLKLGAEAHCYPLAILNWHSLVHDTIGGQGLYVFFDPPSGLAIARRMQSKSRPMALSGYGYDGVGLTYERSKGRLYDMLGGKWLNITPTLSKGFGSGDFDWLPLERMTWKQWRTLHGNTLVLSRDTGYAFDYSFDPYSAAALGPGGAVEDYWSSNTLLAPENLRDQQQTLPDKSTVLAFLVKMPATKPRPAPAPSAAAASGTPDTPAGQTQPGAVPLDALAGAARKVTIPTTAGKVTIYADPANDRYYVQDAQGHWLPQVRLFWYAWKTRFPNTKLYQTQQPIATSE